jgi:hypothetical protein
MPRTFLQKIQYCAGGVALAAALLSGAGFFNGCSAVYRGELYAGQQANNPFEWRIDESLLPDGKITDQTRCVHKTVVKMGEVAFSIGSFRRPYGEAVMEIIDDKCPADFNYAVQKYAGEIIEKNGHDNFLIVRDAALKHGVVWVFKQR